MTSPPRAVPSTQGVSAAAVTAFLDAAEPYELHSLMIVRHGHVVAEGWWHPYTADGLQLLYSLSKSFTSTAIGIAQAEGLLSVDDRIVELLGDSVPDSPDGHLRQLRVRDCLAMATGHRTDVALLLASPEAYGSDPVSAVLRIPAEEPPGTWFTYNQGATLLLSAVITRLTGLRLLDYLRPRLLEPLGIAETNWRGFGLLDEGFSGLHLTTESVAKLGVLYLQHGTWGADRLLPARYVTEATRRHVDTPREPEVDWRQGYGFQFWQGRHGYRGDGAFGQFCLVLPDQDTVVVTTASTENAQGLLDLVWEHLLPGLDAGGSAEEDHRLAERLAALTMDPVPGERTRPTGRDRAVPVSPVVRLSGLTETADGWCLRLLWDGQAYDVECGFGRWLPSTLALGEHHRLELYGSAAWQPDGLLRAELMLIRTPHRLRLDADPDGGDCRTTWNTEPFSGLRLAELALDLRRG